MASIHSKAGKNGKKTFYVVVSQNGRRKWIRAGTLRTAKILKKEIDDLTESQRVEKLGITAVDKRIDEFFKEYLSYVRVRTAPSTVKRYTATINTFITFLKLYLPNIRVLSQLKQEHIELYQQKRLQSVELKTAADGEKNGNHREKRLPKPQTVNYEISVLRSAFLWAHDREMIARVPTRKVKKLRVTSQKKGRTLSERECEFLLSTADEMAKSNSNMKVFALAFRFFLNTGLRSGELCNLTWADVDLESGLIQVRAKPGWTPKSYERSFYLNRASIELLQGLEPAGEYIFLSQTGRQLDSDELRRALIRVGKKAGIQDLTRVHDLRHTFSSIMQMKGVDPGTVATILGHRGLETTAIYTHQTAEHLKKSIEKVAVLKG